MVINILKWKSLSHVWLFATHGLYSPWNSPGQKTRVGSLSLLEGIFPTQGSNPGLPHCNHILYQLRHKGSPRMLEWVAYPFSSGSSQPRNWIGVSCIAGRFFTNWAVKETHQHFKECKNISSISISHILYFLKNLNLLHFPFIDGFLFASTFLPMLHYGLLVVGMNI